MNTYHVFLLSCIFCSISLFGFSQTLIRPSHTHVQVTGRVDTSNPLKYSFAFPGVSIKTAFSGTGISILLKEYGTGGATTTNYVSVIIDGGEPTVMQLYRNQTEYVLATNLQQGNHTVEVFKRTESNVGKIEFLGFTLPEGSQSIAPAALPTRKIEFIGNSITCGYGNEVSTTSPDKYHFTSANENNYMAWGAITARNLNAQYSCVAYSGRGLMQNNTGSKTGTLPLIYDNIIADSPTPVWNHYDYIPDVVVINLGTNDFSAEVSSATYKVDSTQFVETYIVFIQKLRAYYPNASFVCCVGTMMSDYYPVGGKHWTRIQNYVSSVAQYCNSQGDAKVYYLKLDPQSSPYGEDWHPTKKTQEQMATKLTNFIETNISWNDCKASVNLGATINMYYEQTPIILSSQSQLLDNVTYTWYKNGGVLAGETGTSITITDTVGAAGQYVVVRDSAGCRYHDDVVLTNHEISVGEVCKWRDNKRAAIALTFDDWSPGHPAIVVPELQKRGMVGTFNIFTNSISNWTSIQEAANLGNEIANHTKTHPDLTKIAIDELDDEIKNPDSDINSHITNQTVRTFAYPFGTFNIEIINYLKSMNYVAARGVGGISNYTYNFATNENDYYNTKVYSLGTTTSIQNFGREVNSVVNSGGMLTFLYHSVTSPTVVDNNYAAVPHAEFQYQLDTIQAYARKVWVGTYSDIITYHREARAASITQIQAPQTGTWIIDLHDTLSNNQLYNVPLTIVLPMNGVPYNCVKQNAQFVPIDSVYNDTIMFKAIPDAGTIELSVSPIRVDVQLSATEYSNSSSHQMQCTAVATSTEGIASVEFDFTEVQGGIVTVPESATAHTYTEYCAIAEGMELGYKRIYVTVVDNAGNIHKQTVGVHIIHGISVQSSSISQTPQTITFTITASDDMSIESIVGEFKTIQGVQYLPLEYVGEYRYTISFSSDEFAVGQTYARFVITDNSGNTERFQRIYSIVDKTNIVPMSQVSLELFPNPITSTVTIHHDIETKKITIFSNSGKVTSEIGIHSARSTTIDMSEYTSGVYFIQIDGGVLHKIIKL
ncbi:MAG TPA: polysaccharide deacetylase family protein [Bacteroidales bacterium]|nr:polysaccharide deacetylase family protein [Bacteroidales bacterium]